MRIPLRASLVSIGLTIALTLPTYTVLAGDGDEAQSPNTARRALRKKTAEATVLALVIEAQQQDQEAEYDARYADAEESSRTTGVRISPKVTPNSSPVRGKTTPVRGYNARLAGQFTEQLAALAEEKKESTRLASRVEKVKREAEYADAGAEDALQKHRAAQKERDEVAAERDEIAEKLEAETKAHVQTVHEHEKEARESAKALEELTLQLATSKIQLSLVTAQLKERTTSLTTAASDHQTKGRAIADRFEQERRDLKAENRQAIDKLEATQRDEMRTIESAYQSQTRTLRSELDETKADVSSLERKKELLEARISEAEARAAVAQSRSGILEGRHADRQHALAVQRVMGGHPDVESSRGDLGSAASAEDIDEEIMKLLAATEKYERKVVLPENVPPASLNTLGALTINAADETA